MSKCCVRVKQEVLLASVWEPAGKPRISPGDASCLAAEPAVWQQLLGAQEWFRELRGWQHFCWAVA